MEWASTIFPIENRIPSSDYVERIWRTRSVPEKAMIAVAVPHWQLVVEKRSHGQTSVFVRGPETKATFSGIPQDAEFLGIEFKLGAFMPALAVESLVDVNRQLDTASGARVNIAGSGWEIPNFENAEDFVRHLVEKGVLVRDPLVEQAMRRGPVAVSERTVQRRFLRAVGLPFGTVRQIERAERTAAILMAGTSILDTVAIEGYSDQAHLTRALTRFLGKTPGDLVPAKP
jgi:hypothetical protein